jgi:hypothetical protein
VLSSLLRLLVPVLAAIPIARRTGENGTVWWMNLAILVWRGDERDLRDRALVVIQLTGDGGGGSSGIWLF